MQKDVIESVLIGTGGGYGESIVIHLGNNEWMIIDSCKSPDSNDALPIKYLKKRGVDVSKQVKLVLATHWHDDHIRGIASILKECEEAKFSFAVSGDRKKFLAFIGLDSKKESSKVSASSTTEFSECLKIISDRKGTVVQAGPDRLIHSISSYDIDCKVYTLSPSDFTLEQFQLNIGALIRDYGKSNRKILTIKPNEQSVVVYVKVNGIAFLLGSDLEISHDARMGWLCILNNSTAIDTKCNLVKIPHHGSENGYLDRLWSELISPMPISKITPWNRNGKLPKQEMIEKYISISNKLFITSDITLESKKPKKRDVKLAKAIKKENETLHEIKYLEGVIECKYDLKNQDNWIVELYGSAMTLA